MTIPNYSQIACKVCNQSGGIKKANVRRMSGPAVAIGYIFLIPSVLGMLIGVIMLFASGSAGGDVVEKNEQEFVQQVRALGLPPEAEAEALGREAPSGATLVSLGASAQQAREVESIHLQRTAGDVGAGAGAALGMGFSIFMIVGSFVGGLIGWLLTMKKTVLLCGNCKGIHADAT